MTRALRLLVPVGTRPEVIKLAGTVTALRAAGHAVRVVATGQHADPRMAGELFADLGCPPDATWTLEGSEGDRVGRLLALAFAEVAELRPDLVLVLGDTYTAPLVAYAARAAGVGVAHLEAGLRSHNERSTEETNRRMLASLATLHLAPTELAAGFLRAEGVDPARIHVVGNPVVDALVHSGVDPVPVADRRGVLVTAHRATNVDDPARLAALVELVEGLGQRHGPVTFPVHPRTGGRLDAAGLRDRLAGAPGVLLTPPLPYPHLLRALAGSAVAVTDSGGLQEEAAFFGVPAVVMRATTPRWEGVRSGAAVLTGMDVDRVRDAVARLTDPAEQARVAALPCPYGDGRTAARVVALLADPAVVASATPREPVLGGAADLVPA